MPARRSVEKFHEPTASKFCYIEHAKKKMKQEHQTLQQILLALVTAGCGNAVKVLLAMKEISQAELIQRSGISSAELSRVISGKRKTARIRKIIAEAVDVPVDVLFESFDK